MKWTIGLIGYALACGAPAGAVLETLGTFEVTEWSVADPEPAGTYPSPVSALRYEPRVDLQARNLGEAQADLAIRGGIFENASFRLGSVSLLDPQTGHYAAEIPVSPYMLTPADILTGSANAVAGMNTSVGSIIHGFSRIATGGHIDLGAGTDDLVTGSLYAGWASGTTTGWAGDIGVSHSESEGTRPGGSHTFDRYTGRLQYRSEQGQTDIIAGYQSKAFRWPYLYALETLHNLIGSSGIESEALQTQLWMLNHRSEGETMEWNGTLFYRRNRDDYELDVAQPGLYNPYEHETQLWGGGLDGRLRLDRGYRIRGSAQVQADSIDSTALTFGPYRSRTLLHAALVPGREWIDSAGRTWDLEGGVVWDWSNRDADSLSGLLRLGWMTQLSERRELDGYLSFSEASQVPGYTATASNPSGGLFRGKPDLSRETSRNLELGLGMTGANWKWSGALFFRQDRDLVDWVFNSAATPFAARFAENVDIDTLGLEVFYRFRMENLEGRLSYAFLQKDENYGDPVVDGSFYALNYPEHRITAGLVATPRENLTLRLDQEWRVQEPNPLRSGRQDGLFGQFSVTWQPRRDWPMEWTLRVDNLWDVDFEEVPGVPGAGGRRVAVSVRYTF